MSAAGAGRIDAAAGLREGNNWPNKQQCCYQKMTIEEMFADEILSHLDNSVS
jgi:hypothetical protein